MGKYYIILRLAVCSVFFLHTSAQLLSTLRQFGISPTTLLATQRGSQACGSIGCPPGEAPVTRPGHIPQFNGCGSGGFERLLIPELLPFTSCCNQHDKCYDTCGSNKIDCDRQFQICLFHTCNLTNGPNRFTLRNPRRLPSGMNGLVDNCMSTAEMVGSIPLVAGCNSFMHAQTNACFCTDSIDK